MDYNKLPYDQFKQAFKPFLKFPFEGVEKIQTSYSQMHQDMFVLGMLNGKTNGTYLEIGAHHPTDVNNTYLLEKTFEWRGVSVEIDTTWLINWNMIRNNPLLIKDAINLDYDKLLKDNKLGPTIDYLSVDIDPPQGTLDALKKIPHDKYKFNVITFEHSALIPEGIPVREASRKFLSDLGYELIVADVSNEDGVERGKLYTVEDWWVNTSNVNLAAYNRLKTDITKYIASRFTLYEQIYDSI